MTFGALGACIHGALAFTAYVGTRRAEASWTSWYLLRPFMGMALAILFYSLFREGLVAQRVTAEQINVFFMVGMAGLVGLFSKATVKKLQEVFDRTTLPDPEAAFQRRGATPPAQPVSAPSIDPLAAPISTGTAPVSLKLKGKNFVKDSSIEINGEKQPAESVAFVSLEELTLTLDPKYLSPAPRTLRLTVVNPDGAKSQPRDLKVTA
jgi:hypothetical protein